MKIKLVFLFVLLCSSGFSQVLDKSSFLADVVAREANGHAMLKLNTSSVTDNYDVKYHRCRWNIDPNVYFISGDITTYFVTRLNSVSQIEFDFADAMTTDSVLYHGNNVSYTQLNNLLQISLTAPLSSGTLDSVTVYYQGAPAATGFGSFGQSSHNSIPIISTLSEPYGARDWWPCKQSLDDKIDSLDIIIKTPQQFRAGTIGLLLSENAAGSDKIYHWQSHYPITAYLVGIAVTEYAVYSDYLPLNASDTLEILNYVYPEDSAVAVTQTPFIKDVIALYDSLFITYPFSDEKYGHCQWNWGGGEEHQTMSFVSDFTGGLIAHECAHQWFGDYITCASFEDVWLNEGFATYLEALTREFLISPGYWNSWKSSTRADVTSVPNGSVFCTDTTSVGRIFDGRLSYEKGAFVLHMLRWKLGDTMFFQGVGNYLNDPALAYGYAHTSDLKHHLETISGISLTNFFDQWYYNQGYPSYSISWNGTGNDVFVKIQQAQSDPSVMFFEMPLPLRFQDATHDTLIVFDNTFSGQVFQSSIGFSPQTVSFDPDIWILSKNNSVSLDPSLSSDEIRNVPASIDVYPNPVLGKLFINSLRKQEKAIVTLYSTMGQLVFHEERILSVGNNEINLYALPAGVYFLSVKTSENNFNMKIIKQ